MPEFQFDIEEYRRRIAGMPTPELEEYYRQIDPINLPMQWRAVVDELARRGVMAMPQRDQKLFAASQKRGSLPLGLRIGCLGFIFYMIFTGGLMGVFFKNFPMMPGVMSRLSTLSGDGFIAANYKYEKSEGFYGVSANAGPTVRSMIYANGEWTSLPSLYEGGPMLWDGKTLSILGEEGEYTLEFDAKGNPAKSWKGPREIENSGGSCRQAFELWGRAYYLTQEADDKTGEERASLIDRVSGKKAEGQLADALAGVENVCAALPVALNGKLYLFKNRNKKNSADEDMYVSTFDEWGWSSETLFLKGVNMAAVAADSKYIYAVYQKFEFDSVKGPMDALKNMSKNMGRLKAVRFDGKETYKLPDLKATSIAQFDVASDGKNVYVFDSAPGLESPNVYKLEGRKWKLNAKGGGSAGFNMFSGEAKNVTAFGWIGMIPMIVLLVLISSAMIRKERGQEVFLAGRAVKVPTLWRRFGAFSVDWLLFHPAAYALSYIMMSKHFGGGYMPDITSSGYWLTVAIQPAAGVIAMIYFFLCEGFTGRTLGKRLFGLRVVKEDLTPCTPGAAALRALLRIVDGMGFNFVATVAVAHTEKFQRIGDLAAKTVVVMDEPGLLDKEARPYFHESSNPPSL